MSKSNIVLTSSFKTVAKELYDRSLLPKSASVCFITTAGDPYPERPWLEADLAALVEQDKIYVGSSAGSILAGPSVEPFVEEELKELPPDFILDNPTGLGLVDYIILPHQQVPDLALDNDKIAREYGDRFTFVKISDKEYAINA